MQRNDYLCCVILVLKVYKLLHARTFNLVIASRVLSFSSSTFYEEENSALDSTCGLLRTMPTALKPELVT